MPELPEVETIAQNLQRGNGSLPIPGQSIKDVLINWPRHIATPDVDSFRRRIHGKAIQDVRRRGKYLVFPLSAECLLIHLGMSGDLLMAQSADPPGRYDRTVFHFNSGWELRFSDPRKFGKIILTNQPKSILSKLGPEPLSSDFTPEVLAKRMARRKRAIKPLLMDQSFIAGLGNIYTDEALHRTGLHPLRRCNTLNQAEIQSLWQSIRDTLCLGLDYHGASIDWIYRGGDFQNHLRVYRRTGLPCPICGTLIKRIIVNQRSTHFCPICQPEVPK
jgi:formamidopyrimidine-DNA glycosylase